MIEGFGRYSVLSLSREEEKGGQRHFLFLEHFGKIVRIALHEVIEMKAKILRYYVRTELRADDSTSDEMVVDVSPTLKDSKLFSWSCLECLFVVCYGSCVSVPYAEKTHSSYQQLCEPLTNLQWDIHDSELTTFLFLL